MSTSQYHQHTPEEIDKEVKSLLNEMHELLNHSKANPSVEISQKLTECFQKMELLQKSIKQQIKCINSKN